MFAIFKETPKSDGHGGVDEKVEYEEDIDCVSCAFRTSGGINWIRNFDIISKFLLNSTPVYPLDNSPQGIFTIGDIKNQIRRQNNKR